MKKWKCLREFHERALFHILFENVFRFTENPRLPVSLGYCSCRKHLSLGNYWLVCTIYLTISINLLSDISIIIIFTKVHCVILLIHKQLSIVSVCVCSLPIIVCRISILLYDNISEKFTWGCDKGWEITAAIHGLTKINGIRKFERSARRELLVTVN